jgi:hypothetical protein
LGAALYPAQAAPDLFAEPGGHRHPDDFLNGIGYGRTEFMGDVHHLRFGFLNGRGPIPDQEPDPDPVDYPGRPGTPVPMIPRQQTVIGQPPLYDDLSVIQRNGTDLDLPLMNRGTRD